MYSRVSRVGLRAAVTKKLKDVVGLANPPTDSLMRLLGTNVRRFRFLVRKAVIESPIPHEKGPMTDRRGYERAVRGGEILRMRSLMAGLHTLLDVHLFFCDVALAQQSPRLRRVATLEYAALLALQREVSVAFADKLSEFIEDCSAPPGSVKPDVRLILPMFGALSPHSFGALSEFGELSRLVLIDEGRGGLRQNATVELLLLADPQRSVVTGYKEWLPKGEYERYRSVHLLKSEPVDTDEEERATLRVNCLRIETLVRRYLTWRVLLNQGDGAKQKLSSLPEQLDRMVRSFAASCESDGADCQLLEHGEPSCDCSQELETAFKRLRGVVRSAGPKVWEAQQKAARLCDPNVMTIFEYDTGKRVSRSAKSAVGIQNSAGLIGAAALRAAREGGGRRSAPRIVIIAHTPRVNLLHEYLSQEFAKGPQESLFTWNVYIPMLSLGVLPVLYYSANLSREFNLPVSRAYEEIIYGTGGEVGKQQVRCQLALLYHYMFSHIATMLEGPIMGPTCQKCQGPTTLAVAQCRHCGTRHWQFSCVNCGESSGTLSDYLWLPFAIYMAMEKVLKRIPQDWMHTRQEGIQLVSRPQANARDAEVQGFLSWYQGHCPGPTKWDSLADVFDSVCSVIREAGDDSGLSNIVPD